MFTYTVYPRFSLLSNLSTLHFIQIRLHKLSVFRKFKNVYFPSSVFHSIELWVAGWQGTIVFNDLTHNLESLMEIKRSKHA